LEIAGTLVRVVVRTKAALPLFFFDDIIIIDAREEDDDDDLSALLRVKQHL